MEQNKYVDDYTLKEMYENFSNLQQIEGVCNNEFDNGNLFNGKKDNDVYLKLKFTKFLTQYKKTLNMMPPYINKYSDAMIDRIFSAIDTISIGDIKGNVEYDTKSRKIIFSKKAFENQISDDMMFQLTNIALKDMTPTKEEGVELEQIDMARIEYISSKLLKIKHKEQYNSVIGEDTPRLEAYNTLVKEFGEETVLTLNSSNVSKLRAADLINLNGEIDWYYKEDTTPKIRAKIRHELKNWSKHIEKVRELLREDEKEPTENAKKEIKKFNLLLLNCTDIFSEELRKQMNINLHRGVKDIKICKLPTFWRGAYYAQEKLVEISKKILGKKFERCTYIHELMHAATTHRSKYGIPIRVGFATIRVRKMGVALNEGLTEYFSKMLYDTSGGPKIKNSYPELVNITKDIVNLYGKKILIDVMVNKTGILELEKLMSKDGKCLTEFVEITDDFYKCVYDQKLSPYKIMLTSEVAKEKYMRIGQFIDEIKQSRGLENLTEAQKQSEWKNSMYLFGYRELIFKNITSVIKEKFFKKDKTLLLGEGGNTNTNINEQENFKNSLKLENFKTELENSSSNIQPENKEKENRSRVNSDDKDDEYKR